MFDHGDVVVGLWPGETPEDLAGEDALAYLVTVDELNSGWTDDSRHSPLGHTYTTEKPP